MNLGELNRAKVKIRWQRIHAAENSYIARHASQNEHLKARIHGYLCGDGSVSWRRERRNGKLHCEIRFYPDHKSLVLSFTSAFVTVYGKAPHVKKLRNHYRLALTSVIVATDLLRDGTFRSRDWSMPRWVIRNRKNTIEWLRAFFDAEAYIGRDRICVQSVNGSGLHQISGMLEKFGIECKEYSYKRKNRNWNINYHLVIQKKESRCAFLKIIGLNHILKRMRLTSSCRGRITR